MAIFFVRASAPRYLAGSRVVALAHATSARVVERAELHRLAQQRSAQNRDPDYSPFARPESDPPF